MGFEIAIPNSKIVSPGSAFPFSIALTGVGHEDVYSSKVLHNFGDGVLDLLRIRNFHIALVKSVHI